MPTCDTIVSGVVVITVPDGAVTITLPDGSDFNLYNAFSAILDEDGNPILDELACSIIEE